MTVFIDELPNGNLLIQARAEGEKIVGDLVREVGPGGSLFGNTFEELKALGPGQHEIEPRDV